MFYLPVYSFQ
nr:unnamed protein product [Callosobruchus analis]CAI5836728.1 unnamed protein product [Callosobruchus analis]